MRQNVCARASAGIGVVSQYQHKRITVCSQVGVDQVRTEQRSPGEVGAEERHVDEGCVAEVGVNQIHAVEVHAGQGGIRQVDTAAIRNAGQGCHDFLCRCGFLCWRAFDGA